MTLIFWIVMTFFEFAFPDICWAETATSEQSISLENIPVINNPELIIRIKQDKTVLSEKSFSLEDLQKLPLIRETYTSYDADDTPELILAEGISLQQLLDFFKVKLNDVQSFRIYSEEGWIRGLTRKFLYSIPRFRNPQILKQKNDQNPAPVQPMLAIKSYEEYEGTEANWEKLNEDQGIRICYGQITPAEACSTLYGRKINLLEIYVKPSGKDVPEPDANGRLRVISRSDDSSKDEVVGKVIDPVSGMQIDNVPNTLTIKVGYFGQGYTTVKTFSLSELKSLPQIKQAYTSIQDSKVAVETAVGVRLVDVLAAAGIDFNAAQNFYFYTANKPEDSYTRLTKETLLDSPRYFYPRLAECWDGEPTAGAARGAVRVDTMIALKDYWKQGTIAPDFLKVNPNNRFRLVLGQMNTMSDTSELSIPWIHTIEVQMNGKPSDGTGDKISSSVGGGAGSTKNNNSKNKSQTAEEKETGYMTKTSKNNTDNIQKGSGNSVKAVYLVTNAKALPKEQNNHNDYGQTGIFLLGTLLLGILIEYIRYSRDIQVK